MKLSELSKQNTRQEIILNGNDNNNNKLSNYVKTKEIVAQANDIKTIFNMINNFKEERFNYYGDGRDGNLFTTGNVSFPSTTDGPTVYKYFNNLTINEGHTVTVSNRCKGLVIYVKGNCTINGTLSMTARGCRGAGEHFKPNNLDKLNTPDGIIDMSIGATGGQYTGYSLMPGYRNGNNGINGACGSGGSGGGSYYTSGYGYGGRGGSGTTWSGGSGGGGCYGNGGYRSGTYYAQNGSSTGGSGGNGYSPHNSARSSGGGAGNNGGYASGSGASSGDNGTGGLIILVIGKNLIVNGIIHSNGSRGGIGQVYGGGGGGSGGGSITILYKNNFFNNGTIQVNGGSSRGSSGGWPGGGSGGAGSIKIQRIL